MSPIELEALLESLDEAHNAFKRSIISLKGSKAKLLAIEERFTRETTMRAKYRDMKKKLLAAHVKIASSKGFDK